MEIPSCSHEAFFPQSPKVDCDDMHFNNMIFCKTFKIASSILHIFCDDSRRVITLLGCRRAFCEVHLPSIIRLLLNAKIHLPSTRASVRISVPPCCAHLLSIISLLLNVANRLPSTISSGHDCVRSVFATYPR